MRGRDLALARAYCGWPGRPPVWLIGDALTRAWMDGDEQGGAAAGGTLAERTAGPRAAARLPAGMKGPGPRPGRPPSAPPFRREAPELREAHERLGAERVAELL